MKPMILYALQIRLINVYILYYTQITIHTVESSRWTRDFVCSTRWTVVSQTTWLWVGYYLTAITEEPGRTVISWVCKVVRVTVLTEGTWYGGVTSCWTV